MECPPIELNDGSTKIFLNTKGTADDVSPDLKAFLDYVNSGIINGDFVQELDAAVQSVKSNRKALKECITYEMSFLERGLLQGRNQEKESVALKRLRKSSSIDEIYKLTNLSFARIKQLSSNILS